jgi:TolB-like protein
VLPFRRTGDHPDLAALADGFTEDLVTALARFSYLQVLGRSTTRRFDQRDTDVRQMGRELGARYIVDCSVRQSDRRIRVNAHVLDAATGAALWGETYDRVIADDNLFDLQDELKARIASTIADTYGALTRDMAARARTKPSQDLTPFEAVLRRLAFLQSMSVDEHGEVRSALEATVERAPGYADAWAALASLYLDEHQHGFNPRPDPLGRALVACRRALDLDSSNQLGYAMLAVAHYFSGDLGGFHAAADRAVTLNPLDGYTLAFIGALTAYSGEWEKGVALCDRAMALNPNHPGFYRMPAVVNAYRLGAFDRALELVDRVNMPSYPYMHMMMAAIGAELGRTESARAAVRELLRLVPVFADLAYAANERWIPDRALVDRIVESLRKAGLDVPPRP